MRYFLEFSYAGTNYHGWQRQPNAVSVQEVLEHALGTLLKVTTPLLAAGRTDTGVHARQMFAHFDGELSQETFQHLVYQLNQFLPQDIVIHSLRQVKEEVHARFDALSRSYEYHFALGKTPFGNSMHYRINQPLDVDLMNQAADILLTYEDFECFSKSKTDVKTFLCDISYARWSKTKKGYIFTITANRFLRNMVRAIVGTLIEIGLKKKTIEDLHEIIKSKNRSKAGYSVPAQGLFLTRIEYPASIYK
ncbi:tRNA pseudouridine(38-40) synthase TruA [Flavobacteriaceae bacterium]|nr:tRNA pseudouridine(38-40) synthase TruA [Flavobacteriaceae bacterium]